MQNSPIVITLIRQLFCSLMVLFFISCSGVGTPPEDQLISVAVWDLEDLTPQGNGTGMVEVITGRIIERLSEIDHYQVVERQQLVKAMEELSIGSSELADAGTRLKLGKLLGAKQMVFGVFQVIGKQVRLDIRCVDVASGKILRTATTTTAADNINEWIRAADQLVEELAE